MNIFEKPIENLTLEDIKELVDKKIPESQKLEYKEKSYTSDREGKREMLKDIASMANAYGGYIIIGIKEDGKGCAEEIVGIEEAKKEEHRITSICEVYIKERIRGLKIHLIPVEEDKNVLVIYVPRSLYGPHMITFEDMNQFWIRHNTQKSLMSIEEIRDTFLKSKEMVIEIKEFINRRKNEIISYIGEQPYFIMGALPFPLLREEIDTKNPELRKILSFSKYGSSFPTLEGIRYGDDEKNWELFRNGYLEFKAKLNVVEVYKKSLITPFFNESFKTCYPYSYRDEVKIKLLYPIYEERLPYTLHPCSHNVLYITVDILTFFEKLKEIKEFLGLEESYIVFVWMLNIKDTSITLNEVLENNKYAIINQEVGYYNKPNLEISLREVYDFSDPKKVAKDFCDRIFNAYGFEECPEYYLYLGAND